jgi:hypothetical protein
MQVLKATASNFLFCRYHLQNRKPVLFVHFSLNFAFHSFHFDLCVATPGLSGAHDVCLCVSGRAGKVDQHSTIGISTIIIAIIIIIIISSSSVTIINIITIVTSSSIINAATTHNLASITP